MTRRPPPSDSADTLDAAPAVAVAPLVLDTHDELDPVRAEFDAGQDTPRVAVGSERDVEPIAPSLPAQAFARIVSLETRCDACEARWLRLQGVDERNGRIGRLDQRVEDHHADVLALIAELRADVGTADERRAERGQVRQIAAFRKWSLAKLLGASATIAAALYGYVRVRDDARTAAAAAAARTEIRIEHVEATTNRLLDLLLNRPRNP